MASSPAWLIFPAASSPSASPRPTSISGPALPLAAAAGSTWPSPRLSRAYTAHLTTYENLLTRRNALLRRLQGGLGRPTELEFWDDRISEPAVAVTRARAAYVARVRAPVNLGFEAMQGGARLDLAYRAAGLGLDAQGYRIALNQRRNRDIQRGTSSLGPHRRRPGSPGWTAAPSPTSAPVASFALRP